MAYAFCIVPVAPIRAKSAHDAEMSSQLLFGEFVELVSAPVNGFVEVVSLHDHYRGFMAWNQLQESPLQDGTIRFAGEWMNSVLDQHGQALRVPFGSVLHKGVDEFFDYSGVREIGIIDFSVDALQHIIHYYVNVPYLWGGRSVFGIDCSGFAQSVYKSFGASLPRDAWQQARVGELITFGEHKEGDLAFFELNGKVVHVGVITGAKEITHAYGKVRKDMLTEKGIFNRDSGLETHRMHSIRRVM